MITKIATIKATHAGYVNGNNSFYPEEDMAKAVASWTYPYNKPILTHHDSLSDAIGYVIEAKYVPLTPDGDSDSPRGYIELKADIGDSIAAEKIEKRIYNTVSIGATASNVECSVCDHSISEDGLCEHVRGKTYKGKKAYWRVGDITYKECSYVNKPADGFASTTSIEEAPSISTTTMINNEDGHKKLVFTFADNEGDGKTKDHINNEVKMDKVTLTQLLEDREDLRAHIDAKLADKEREYKDQTQGSKALGEKVETLETTVADKDKEITSLKSQIEKLEEDSNKLRDKVHDNLVDRVYEKQVSLQKKVVTDLKDDEETKGYKASLSTRTDDSLSDALTDLNNEAPISNTTKKVKSTPDNLEDADGEEESKPTVKTEDRVKNLIFRKSEVNKEKQGETVNG